MSKKSKKMRQRKWEKRHAEFIDRFLSSSGVEDAHIMPMSQPWHIPKGYCFCNPEVEEEHPITMAKVWVHRVQIH